MAGDTRSTVVLLASLLLLSSLPYLSVAETTDLAFTLEETPSYLEWYVAGDTVELTAMFTNNGPSTTIVNDPSCGVVLQVFNAIGTLLIDDSSTCRGQTQNLDLGERETYLFENLTWDLQLEENVFVEPGVYTVSAYHSGTQSTASKVIHVQTPVEVSLELDLILELSSRLNTIQQNEEVILTVLLKNPTNQAITHPENSSCLIELNINSVSSLGMPCFNSNGILLQYEKTLLGHILLEDGSLNQGLNTIQARFPSELLMETISFTIDESDSIDTSLQNIVSTQIISTHNRISFSSQQALLSSSLILTNDGVETVSLQFTDSCRAEMWVLNERGDVVFDSRMLKNCNDLEIDYLLNPNEQIQFNLPDWTFTDLEGCEVLSGDYTLVTEIPEFHLSDMQIIHYEQRGQSDCNPPPALNFYPNMSSNDKGFEINLEITPLAEDIELYWVTSCAVIVSIIDLSVIEQVYLQPAMCDSNPNRHTVFPSGDNVEPLILAIGQVDMVDQNLQPLPEGQYQILFTVETNPQMQVGFSLSWPIVNDDTMEQVTEVIVVEPKSRLISGTWSGLQTEQGTCWMLESPNEGQLLLSSATLGQWLPRQGQSGTYEIVDAQTHPACENFQAPSFQVRGIEIESQQEILSPVTEVSESEVELSVQEQAISSIPTVLVVVTTGSILSLLVTFVLGNESLRIPSTAAGLWFLGLLGRTHETTDGRYQRGRLMGYLTANPGCHFRALMAALEMSNGQITHHLRILESEEGIWRRKDGRLMRYYPYTNSLYPSMSEDDLPVPPLSPDPNSLQGKILSLLDHDGPLGEFPTQAELAVRLEKSQQLVSHHLRTLQKFGLVEKRKMGVKNRYKLTREAILLLESNTDFTRED